MTTITIRPNNPKIQVAFSDRMLNELWGKMGIHQSVENLHIIAENIAFNIQTVPDGRYGTVKFSVFAEASNEEGCGLVTELQEACINISREAKKGIGVEIHAVVYLPEENR